MRRAQILRCCVVILFAFGLLSAMAAELGTISGVVHDANGAPLAGVRITITARNSSSTKQTTSDAAGKYVFSGLADGQYTITAELAGYASVSSPMVGVATASPPVTADLTLTRAASASGAPPIHFQASGIRGLIDPGGYSASANAAAATGVVRGIADIKRTDSSFRVASAKDWPCAMEPVLRQAVVEHPEKAAANRRLGQFYLAHGQIAKAIPPLTRATQIDAADFDAARDLAVAQLQSGQFAEARTLLSALVEHHPTPEGHQLFARAYEGSGMFQQAAEEYRVADKEQPSEESLFGVGYELILAATLNEALTAFQTGEQQFPHSVSLLIGAGSAQFLLGHMRDGVATFLQAAKLQPSDPRPYAFLASASGLSGVQSDQVRNSLKAFLDHAPDNALAHYYYALSLSQESSPDNGRITTLLKRAIQLDPGLAKAHLLLASTYAQSNDDADAVPEYEAAVRLSPDGSEAHYRLAMAYKRTGHAEQSAREMQVFQQAKAHEKATPDSGIDVAQFISAMDAPTQSGNTETQCPSVP